MEFGKQPNKPEITPPNEPPGIPRPGEEPEVIPDKEPEIGESPIEFPSQPEEPTEPKETP